MIYRRLLVSLLLLCAVISSHAAVTCLFVGSYTDGRPGKGIYVYRFDSGTGRLQKVWQGHHIINPSFLTLSPDGRFLYACTETKLLQEGTVSAFAIDSLTGALRLLNKQPGGGENPVYITTTADGRWVINANYTEGNVSVYKVRADGSLGDRAQLIPFYGKGPIADRQEKAHIHAAVLSPDGRFVYFPDLGTDKIHAFSLHPERQQPLVAADSFSVTCTPGSGPRHFTFHPSGQFAYCIEELGGAVAVYSYRDGRLNQIQRLASYRQQQARYSSADIHISPDGLFLYASNRWEENTLSIFSIDTISGMLALVGHQSALGDHPRNFVIDPTGNFLLVANQLTNDIVVFRRDAKTGLLKKVGKRIKIAAPSCLQMRVY